LISKTLLSASFVHHALVSFQPIRSFVHERIAWQWALSRAMQTTICPPSQRESPAKRCNQASGPGQKESTMKTMFLAAAAALTLGMGSAFAQSSQSASGYVYPGFWGTPAAQSAPRSDSVSQSNGGSMGTYATQTHTEHNGTWLFPADPWGGGNG
jgi:hypothetical protein